MDEVVHPFVIVLTQDCDLEQDFELRGTQDGGALPHLLLCEAAATSDLKAKVSPGKDIWKRIIQNKDERYQCLEEVPAEQDAISHGIPSLGCDFKRYFTAPTDEVYKRIDLSEIARRSRLLTPYAEHLLHRFCNFQARVPLPQAHKVNL